MDILYDLKDLGNERQRRVLLNDDRINITILQKSETIHVSPVYLASLSHVSL